MMTIFDSGSDCIGVQQHSWKKPATDEFVFLFHFIFVDDMKPGSLECQTNHQENMSVKEIPLKPNFYSENWINRACNFSYF